MARKATRGYSCVTLGQTVMHAQKHREFGGITTHKNMTTHTTHHMHIHVHVHVTFTCTPGRVLVNPPLPSRVPVGMFEQFSACNRRCVVVVAVAILAWKREDCHVALADRGARLVDLVGHPQARA